MIDELLVYAGEEPPEEYDSMIFLEGPSPAGEPKNPREAVELSAYWRDLAVEILREIGYTGVIVIPLPRPGTKRDPDGHVAQVVWEDKMRRMADVILAWVPRFRKEPGKLRRLIDRFLSHAPGFRYTNLGLTTNWELGQDVDSGKLVFGAPDDSWKTRTPRYWAEQLKVPVRSTLRDTVVAAVEHLGTPALRKGGERYVPLFIWRTKEFRQWYRSVKRAGNRLDYARVAWTWRVGSERKFVFFWALHVHVWIESEGRHKTNEVVLSRPDISTIVLYQRAERLDDTRIVLVKEFRSPAANDKGYVYENAGGSSWDPKVNPFARAREECKEETDLDIRPSRFRVVGNRQIMPTAFSTRAFVFAAELTAEEMDYVEEHKDKPLGVKADSERTFRRITTLGEIRDGDYAELVGWGDLGMIMAAVA